MLSMSFPHVVARLSFKILCNPFAFRASSWYVVSVSLARAAVRARERGELLPCSPPAQEKEPYFCPLVFWVGAADCWSHPGPNRGFWPWQLGQLSLLHAGDLPGLLGIPFVQNLVPPLG